MAVVASTEELNHLISSIQCSNHARVRNDILALCSKYPGLRFQSTVHIHNDGSECLLIMLKGTIPITFKSAVYHIPIELLISSSYPESIPMCFVRPVKGMEVVHQHRFVNTDGKIFHPCLNHWNTHSSSLVDLTNNLVEVFSQKPPVFSVQPHKSPALPRKSPSFTSLEQKEQPVSNDPQKRALQQLTSTIKEQLRGIYLSGRNETEANYRLRSKLEKGAVTMKSQITELNEYKLRLLGGIQEANQANTDIDTWLELHADKQRKGGDDSQDDLAMIPSDGQSAKLFELVSESAALEDTMYALDRALMREAISLEEFMKHLRELSRQQFLCQAHIQKISKVQMDSRAASP